MKKRILFILLSMTISLNVFALTGSDLQRQANVLLRTIFDTYSGANVGQGISELVSEDYYPLRRTFLDEFKYSRTKIKSCRFEYKINEIKDNYTELLVDINWQKKIRQDKKSIIETTKGNAIFVFDKEGKLLKFKGDNPFR